MEMTDRWCSPTAMMFLHKLRQLVPALVTGRRSKMCCCWMGLLSAVLHCCPLDDGLVQLVNVSTEI
jgi:hypothetical protein